MIDLEFDPRQRFAQTVRGPSHTLAFKAAAVGLLVLIALYAVRVLKDAPEVSEHVGLLALGAAGLLLISAWWLLFGSTTVDATGIHRSGWWRTDIKWEEIGRAKFLRVPFSPRLVVLPTHGPMRSFFAGNAALEDAFREIERIYKSGR